MNQLVVDCIACGQQFPFARSRSNQRLARVCCPSCGVARIVRFYGSEPERSVPGYEAQHQCMTSLDDSLNTTGAIRRALQVENVNHGAKVALGVRPRPSVVRSVLAAGASAAVPFVVINGTTFGANSPIAASVYATVGLPLNTKGLAFKGVTSNLMLDEGQRILVVTGAVENLRKSNTLVPNLIVSIRNESANEIYQWETPPPKKTMSAGETIIFRARLAAAPEISHDVKVRFAGIDTPSK